MTYAVDSTKKDGDMDQLINSDKQKQRRRVSFSDVTQGPHEDYIDITKSKSFRDEEGNAKLRRDLSFNAKEIENAASIAAATYAIYSLEETRAEFERKMVESFREDPSQKREIFKDQQNPLEDPDFRGSSRRSSRVGKNDGGGGPILRNNTRPIEIRGPMHKRTMESNKADAWEQARLAKISVWYKKMNTKIIEWENEKKKRATLDMETRKVEIERLKRINTSHYKNKIARIEGVAQGARNQLEEKKRSEEINAKHKARKIKSLGRKPLQCFCFEY